MVCQSADWVSDYQILLSTFWIVIQDLLIKRNLASLNRIKLLIKQTPRESFESNSPEVSQLCLNTFHDSYFSWVVSSKFTGQVHNWFYIFSGRRHKSFSVFTHHSTAVSAGQVAHSQYIGQTTQWSLYILVTCEILIFRGLITFYIVFSIFENLKNKNTGNMSEC